tara:strand:- start:3256 stop:3678 length:423 start_codon:yes stop_codon:yes gene_type:complete
MPKSLVSKKKLFRDFSRLNQRYVKNNYLKKFRSTMLSFCSKKDVFEREMLFMLWCYDLEFFTLRYAADDYEYSEKKLAERLVYPLVKEGYLYKHFDKLTPSQTMEDHLFREETKMNYRVRYALSQRGRLLVQAFYKKLES